MICGAIPGKINGSVTYAGEATEVLLRFLNS
jgi:hypothetical protein